MRLAPLLMIVLTIMFSLACGADDTAPVPAAGTTAAPPTAVQEPTAGPTETPTAEAVSSPTPSATAAPTASAVPSPTMEPMPTQEPATSDPPPATTPALTPVPSPTAPPTLTATPTPTAAPAPTPGPAATPAPTAVATPVATATSTPVPTPTRPPTPSPTPTPSVNPALAEYSALLAKAASGLDFVRDGLSDEEKNILDWADSRLFGNPAFLDSTWGPDNWPVDLGGLYEREIRKWAENHGFNFDDVLPDEELRLASAQAILLLMGEIDIQVKSDGRHVVSWEVDALDRVLDDLKVYPGMCVHCYGRTGYETYEGLAESYGVILGNGHAQREMLKTFAYFAKADGLGILVRGFMENDADDFDLLYKRKLDEIPVIVGAGSFANANINFMSQIRLPEGELESYPTMAFGMVRNARSEREAVERVFDYMRTNLVHVTGDHDDLANHYRPHSVTPYSPELGWILYVGEAGSGSTAGAITGAFRALGLKAEQFKTPRKLRRAGLVEAEGRTGYYNGNDFLGEYVKFAPLCLLLDRTLEQIEDTQFNMDCDK